MRVGLVDKNYQDYVHYLIVKDSGRRLEIGPLPRLGAVRILSFSEKKVGGARGVTDKRSHPLINPWGTNLLSTIVSPDTQGKD